MANTTILFENADGTVSEMWPVLDCGLTLAEIIAKDVPQGARWLVLPEGDTRPPGHEWSVDWDTGLIRAVLPPPKVPEIVTRRQLHLALQQMGLRAAVLTWVANADEATRIEFEMAGEFRRDHPMWAVGAAALDKTPADIDALFILAATL